MSGYRTIPTKDTFDVDERLGGVVTIKQLTLLIFSFALTYATFLISAQYFEDPSDSIYVWGSVLFFSLLFAFSNADQWFFKRLNYYVLTDSKKLERHPELLRNIRAVEEDKIVTLDGRVIAMLKVTPVNFPLLSDEAKEAKIAAFEMYLRQLVYPIMHYVQSSKVDPSEYISNISKEARESEKSGVNKTEEYIGSHIKFLRNYLKTNNSRTKNHYVVLHVKDPRYSQKSASPRSSDLTKMSLLFKMIMTELSPFDLMFGGKLIRKPKNYVKIDATGKKLVFNESEMMPEQLPENARQIGPVLQFDTKAQMLRFALKNKKRYYYGLTDVDELLRLEFRDMGLKQRENEFSVEERRHHVALSGGKTRWAFDEVEKHISVLSDKLESTGLRVHRVRGDELYKGKQTSLINAKKVRCTPHFMKIDEKFVKVIFATGYPYQVNLGWLTNIVDGREDYDLTMYIYPININEAISTFRTAILKLSTEKKARSDFLDPEKEQNLEDIRNFYTQIVSGKEKYFLASLYITAKADGKKSLDTVLEKCRSDLAGASIDYEMADYDMSKAVYSTRLTGSDVLAKKREFPTSSLAATFPHISSSVEMDPTGMFFGFDYMNAPIILDLTKLTNQHISITGESGSGKSYFSKSIIPHYLISGYRVFITDPDGEYVRLAKHFGGSVSSVGPRKDAHINPFDLAGRDVNDKIRSLIGLFSIICGSLNKYQEGIVSEVLIELFSEAQKKDKEVTMSDFAKELEKMLKKTKDEQIRHDLQFLLMAIRPFLKGNIYGFIDNNTSVKIGEHMHVFDLREYKNDRTLKDFFNYLIFDYISHRLLEDRSKKALIMDEGWTMVNYPSSEDYVQYIIKDSRKYNVSFVFITQELEDMLSSKAGRSVMNNTSTQFLFHQKESAMNLMKKTLNLTDTESEKLLATGKGEGLMISDKNRLFFKVRTSSQQHKIITTDPNEPAKKVEKPAVIEKKIGLEETQRQIMSPAIKSAIEANPHLSDILTNIENKTKESEGLPIALTHGLVSPDEAEEILKKKEQDMLKSSTKKEEKKSSKKSKKKSKRKRSKKKKK